MKNFIFCLLTLLATSNSFAFCGFYVAQADAKLFNKTSEVIIARQGEQTVVTMSSDFEGDVQDFAMVIPVPQVPTREMIRVADPMIFSKLDAYSGPRIVEYYDGDPCGYDGFDDFESDDAFGDDGGGSYDMDFLEEEDKQNQVTVKARYTVGEYDIVIIEAEEAGGLVTWLTAKKYQIPEKAKRLLAPYIRNGMYFFLVKVNLEELAKGTSQELRPIQLTYESERFMLPIRLGMANAIEDQDMLVYAFSDRGRIECTNYQTLQIPTDQRIPEFVADTFGAFYSALFEKSWKEAGENVVFTEYSWDLDAENFTKCDPCATTPPIYDELREAGVFWLEKYYNPYVANKTYNGKLHFTRLHVRYRTETFPQDLMFQVTPDKVPFQGRYVVHRIPDTDFDCTEGQNYLKGLVETRKQEVDRLVALTGWPKSHFEAYPFEYVSYLKTAPWLEKIDKEDKGFFILLNFCDRNPWILWILVSIGLFFVVFSQKKRALKYLFS